MSVECFKSGKGWVYRERQNGRVIRTWRESKPLGSDQLVEVLQAPSSPVKLAVALTCHSKYTHWLEQSIAAIDSQTVRPEMKILCLDRCADKVQELLSTLRGWSVLIGDWGSPIPARNEALKLATSQGCTWVIGADADNFKDPGYVAAMAADAREVPEDVGCIYPDIQYVDAEGNKTRLRQTPEVTYWDLRNGNPGIDTSSCWRISALNAIGGHVEGTGMDDYALAMKMTAAGWSVQHASPLVPPTNMREHDLDRRSMAHLLNNELALDQLWKIRSQAVIVLLAPGRQKTQARALGWLREAALPEDTVLYVGDNTGDNGYAKLVLGKLYTRFDIVSVTRFPVVNLSDWSSRHQHIARLYRKIFSQITEDVVLTLEDDMEPGPQDVRELYRHLTLNSPVGAVGAAYSSPEDTSVACASSSPERWQPTFKMDNLPESGHPVAMIGGGLTLWGGWAVHKALPVEFVYPMGWDATLSRRIVKAGYTVLLDGSVRVPHHVHGAMED